MDRNAYRDDNDTGQPDASQPDDYWRRRVITLCAGLALLGLLAWAFSGGGGKPVAATKAAQASGALPATAYSGTPASGTARTSGPRPAPATVPGRRRPGLPVPRADASASAGSSASLPPHRQLFAGRQHAGASASAAAPAPAARAARGAAAAKAAAGPASGVEPGGGCAPNAIVLSVFTSKTSYHAGQYPVFEVYAVSTASRACTFNLGPAKLHVLVSSSGRVIWDSADCTRARPNKRAELRRGVPAQESLSWNRTISLPGCVTMASSARPGPYQVQARDASVASPFRTFKLAR